MIVDSKRSLQKEEDLLVEGGRYTEHCTEDPKNNAKDPKIGGNKRFYAMPPCNWRVPNLRRGQ
jgi:hypothetical protein